jgi:hypothetical protein
MHLSDPHTKPADKTASENPSPLEKSNASPCDTATIPEEDLIKQGDERTLQTNLPCVVDRALQGRCMQHRALA